MVATSILVAGCGGSSSSGSSGPASPTGNVLPFATVQGMKAGTTFYIILDRAKGKVTWPVTLSGTSDESGARQILFTIANQPIGSGDSGALIIDGKGNSVGALDSGFDTTSSVFTATAIEDEESILLSSPASKKVTPSTATNANDGLRHLVRGVSPYMWGIISKDARNPISKLFTLDTTSLPVKSPKNAVKNIAGASLPYGRTMFVMSSYGDAVTSYTYGTVTTPYLNKLLCFGHALNWEGGSLNMPVYYGTVDDFVVDPDYGGEKIAYPNLSALCGSLVDDRRFGVVIDPTVAPVPIPVTGTVTVNTNQPVTFHGFVSQDSMLEASFVLTNIGQGVSNILDASDAAGSATGSATIMFADGTSQTVDLTDSGSTTLISDLYYNIEDVIYNLSTGEPIPLQSVTFTFTVTTS